MSVKRTKEYNDSPKKKNKKIYSLYYKFSDSWWQLIKDQPWHRNKENIWRKWRSYTTEKDRENALVTMQKNSIGYQYLFSKNLPPMYVFCREEDLNVY